MGEPLDIAMRELRAILQQHEYFDAEIRVRVDGRVWIDFVDSSGNANAARIKADVHEDATGPLPSAAVRARFSPRREPKP